MDDADHATEIEEFDRALGLAALAGTRPVGPSAHWCQNMYCGIEIPEERRLAVPGVQLCVDCQKLKERV